MRGIFIAMPYLIGIAIMVVFIGLLTCFGLKRKKAGKIDEHWKDY